MLDYTIQRIMKYCVYILVIGFVISFTSCSKSEENDNDFLITNNEIVCLPFISSDLILQDLADIPVDQGTEIVSHSQEEDCLLLDTRFGGGCEEHVLQLFIDIQGSAAVNLSESLFAILSHDNTDQCEAIVALEVGVDISKLRDLQKSEILLNIEGYSEQVTINF